ncbi:MAG: ribonuclease HII [Calditrichaeota bacterium]|nr:ribonuclease HII [Calditrichota bacterium]RQW07808.1 MAG: ribonuclease HII [Calditrichota bacterium]
MVEKSKTSLNLKIEKSLWKQGFTQVAGVDEAGCGPLAGPVVAAAVILPIKIRNLEIRDSKKLLPAKREKLYTFLVENSISYGVGIVSHEEIDRINIRQASFLAMRMAIEQLIVEPDYLLVDGFKLPETPIQQLPIVNGDESCFSIASASIIAKVTRDRLMDEYHLQFPQYGFNKHRGYATAYHREMLIRFGPCELHRKTFLRKIFP